MRQKKYWFRISRIAAVFAMTLVLLTGAMAASTYKLLHRFKGGADGAYSQAGLIFDAAGNLYGTTTGGGHGAGGTVFKLRPNSDGSWTETVLYRFCSLANCTDGHDPSPSLIFDASGNLYGTTNAGGAVNVGAGVVFELTPHQDGTWTESVLYNFCSVTDCADGVGPLAGLIFDASGNLYGTTTGGGTINGGGVVFKLTPSSGGTWTETVLYRFSGGSDGYYPTSSLVLDAAGNLYGTTYWGGNRTCNSSNGCGVVFKLTRNSNGTWTQKVLHTFNGGADGRLSFVGLIFDSSGNLYGTATGAGAYGYGVAFMLKPNPDGSWTEYVLHSFRNRPAANPWAGLTFDAAGNLYGTTLNGGSANGGVVFKMTPQSGGSWAYSTLHVFAGKPAMNPYGSVVLDKAGNLYGTTFYCASGTGCYGVVYEVTP